MKLEVGMYCYDKTNRKLGIGKIINFQRNNNVNIRYKNDIELVSIGNVKASHNIIDLIEVGDYVNGCYIQEIKSLKDNVMVCMLDSDYEFLSTITNKEIETILTKEQFESMEYKVVE